VNLFDADHALAGTGTRACVSEAGLLRPQGAGWGTRSWSGSEPVWLRAAQLDGRLIAAMSEMHFRTLCLPLADLIWHRTRESCAENSPSWENIMCDWEWESFSDFVNYKLCKITNAGPLCAPINRFSIRRNEKLELIMETVAEQNAKSYTIAHPPGTVRINTDTLILSTAFGTEMVASGVQSLCCKTFTDPNSARSELREDALIHNISGVIRKIGEVKYVIDWLANVEDCYLWPNRSDCEIIVTKTHILNGGDDKQTLISSQETVGGGWNCAKICVDGVHIYLGVSKPLAATKINKPGFILYVGNQPEEFREKIRNCLSFALGEYLVYLGCSSFCEDWSLASFRAVSAYSLGGKAFDIPAMPPAPLGTQYEWEINREFLSRMANSIYLHYDALEFASLSWAYWHAVGAAPHIAPVHFGAAIESLQRSYVKLHPETCKTFLLDRQEWETLRTAVENVISNLSVDKETKKILKNKINDLRTAPRSIILESLLEALNINLSKVEKDAWKRRNYAGHGSRIKEEDYINLIKDTKLLKMRFHRMLWSIPKASDLYYDYYSLNRPVRYISDPIP
jgi:hypothetical protein